jgi:hypothetical protein
MTKLYSNITVSLRLHFYIRLLASVFVCIEACRRVGGKKWDTKKKNEWLIYGKMESKTEQRTK